MARTDVRARSHGRKAYQHRLVGLLELHRENFALPDESGMELLVLSAPAVGPAGTDFAFSRAWRGQGDAPAIHERSAPEAS